MVLALAFFITACSPSSLLTKSAVTNMPIIPTMSPAPTHTTTPIPSPTILPISTVEKEAILQSYKVLLFIQIDVNMLEQIATKVNSGELTGFDSFGSIFTLAALVKAVDEAIPQTTVPEIMKPNWDQAISIHDTSKDLIYKWVNDEIISTDVLEKTPSLLKKIDKIMDNIEKELESSYGFDAQELNKTREDAIKSMDDIFATSTPQP